MVSRLKSSIGINGTVLNWFTSDPYDRLQRVSLNGCTCDSFRLPYGVPQVLCLEPLLFIIYSTNLFEIIKYHLHDAQAYLDNTQLYLSFTADSDNNQTDAVVAMEPSILDIRTWMLTDKLKRDDGKTEFTLMRMKQQLSKVNIDSLTVGSIGVVDVTVARNLGLWFDSYLNLREQIHNTFFHLHNIQRIRKYLSQEFTRTLVDMLLS